VFRAGSEGTVLSALVPAKINLWLEVIGKRADGYHELSTLMLPVGVYDRLEIMVNQNGVTLECTHPDVPQDSRNLAWRAAELLLREARQQRGVHLRLDKHIPVGAGLGGGSADAGAVLALLNSRLPEPLPPSRLAALARSLGADVAFFLHPRAALATGIGEHLQPVSGVPKYPLLLIKPPILVPTGPVYQRLKLTRGQSHFKIPDFRAQPWDLQRFLENDLEAVTVSDHPVVVEIKDWLRNNGALGALMSGSGPTVFGVFATREQAEATVMPARATWRDCWVEATAVIG
jgi:4-diphosphocytidyl-2-C-methyl-D-erythritol kinase